MMHLSLNLHNIVQQRGQGAKKQLERPCAYSSRNITLQGESASVCRGADSARNSGL